MGFLIVEDEKLSAERLVDLLTALDEVDQQIDIANSMEAAKKWLSDNPEPELIFLDIELGDGTAFDLLGETKLNAPVIFTTAYDQHAIKAFKFNSIDYLLKPIDPSELKSSLEKWMLSKDPNNSAPDWKELKNMIDGNYKKRFLVKSGDQFHTIPIEEISYFFSEDSYTFLLSKEHKKWIIDYSLEDLEEVLDPQRFFRLNRKLIAPVEAIKNVSSYFNGRLVVKLSPDFQEQIVISREKVKPFKSWLDG